MHTTTAKIGENRGNPRIYMQGKWLIEQGFEPGARFDLMVDVKRIVLKVTDEGDRKVSGKKDGSISVIDINFSSLREILGRVDNVQIEASAGTITITPAKTARKRASRTLTATAVAIFAGCGLLCQAAEAAGFTPAAAIEVDDKYADIYHANHPTAHMYNMAVEEVDLQQVADRVGPVGLLTMGIPCEPFSTIRRAKDGQADRRTWIEHDLAHLFFYGLMAIDTLNPHTVVIEEVPGFLDSQAADIVKLMLTRWGYNVDARVISPIDHGGITTRKRAVIVGTTHDRVQWPDPKPDHSRRMGQYLLPPDHPEVQWWSPDTIKHRNGVPWPVDHWRTQTAKGNGFAPPVLTRNSDRCPTITKRYWSGRGDTPVVEHPEKPGVYRWLTLTEGRRIMGLPDDYWLGDSKTTAGEAMGQGVDVGLFSQIIASVAGTVKDQLAAA